MILNFLMKLYYADAIRLYISMADEMAIKSNFNIILLLSL